MAELPKAADAVVGAYSTVPNPTQGKRIERRMHGNVADRHAAGGGIAFEFPNLLPVLPKVIRRQRPWVGTNEFDDVLNLLIASQLEDLTKNLFVKNARVRCTNGRS